MALEAEIALYEELLPALLASDGGRYAVIKGDRYLGAFDDMDVGYRAALESFGVTNFLLRRIQIRQPAYDITHLQLGLVRAIR